MASADFEFPADAGLPQIGVQKKAVVVVHGVPHPSEGASAVLFYWYIAALRAAGFEILNVLLLDEGSMGDGRTFEAYGSVVDAWDRFDLLVCRSPKFAVPTVYGIRFDEKAFESIEPSIRAFRPDVILCLDFTSAVAARTWQAAARLVWLGDLAFQTGWYHTRYSFEERQVGLKVLVGTALVIWHWRRAYKNILRHFDRIVASSKAQEDVLRAIGLAGAVYLPYPWPAVAPRDRDIEKSSAPTLLFAGTLQGLGSRSAFRVLIGAIYPALVRAFGEGGFKIIVCGRGDLAPWVKQAFETKPEFEYRGFVPDIEGLMSRCHAMLVPIDVPVGNRSRILTAWSQRLLVIAHQSTALGNPDLVDGSTCYLAATPDQFVDRITRAVREPAEARRVAEQGYRTYREKFSPVSAARLLLAEIGKALSESHEEHIFPNTSGGADVEHA